MAEKLKKEYDGRLNIQLDLVHTKAIEQNPDQFFLGHYPTPLEGKLSDMLAGLVIEPDGEVVPLQYGFSREYSLGNLREKRISEMVDEWRNNIGPGFHRLCFDLNESLRTACDGQFINWYERLDQHAKQTQVVTFPEQSASLDSPGAEVF